FVDCTRSHTSSEVSSTDASSGGPIPALLNSTSIRPSSSRTRAYVADTLLSSVTSAWSASSPTECSSKSTPTTLAPSRANTSAPAITQTFPSSLISYQPRGYDCVRLAGATPGAGAAGPTSRSIVRTGPLNVFLADTRYQIVTAKITTIVTSGA